MNAYEYIDKNNLYQSIIDVVYDFLIPGDTEISATTFCNYTEEKLYNYTDGEWIFKCIEENVKYPIYYVPIDMLINRKYIKSLNLVVGQRFKNSKYTDKDIEAFVIDRYNTLKKYSHRTLTANEHDFIIEHYDYFYSYIYYYTTSTYKENYITT